MKIIKTQALVIGSGFGAAAPALRMAEAGIEVLMIEKGPDIIPDRDFKQTLDPKYVLKYLKGMSSDTINFTYAEGLGGGSGFYEMVSLRAPSSVFEQRDEHGRNYWSGITRATLNPYYDRAEKMLNVEQIEADEIPKSGVAFSLMMKNLGYSCDRARYAAKGCVGSGYCVTGCVFGAKQSLHLNYLPQARALGMNVITELEALSIEPTTYEEDFTASNFSSEDYRYKVVCRKTDTGEEYHILAHIVVMGGGTVGTAVTLLRSKDRMVGLNEHVGQHIAYNGSIKAAGILPEGFIEGDMLSGRSHPGMVSYHFFDELGIMITAGKPLPLDVTASVNLALDGDIRDPQTWGEPLVEMMKLYRRRMIILLALGLTPPAASIERTGKNTFTPKLELTNSIRQYVASTKKLLHSILEGNNCRIVEARFLNSVGREYDDIHLTTTHMIGSCRMAESPNHGVCNTNGEVFGYPGLFISDGAAVPTSLAVNSSLTILANAERIGSHIANTYGKEGLAISDCLYNIELPG